MRPLAVVLSCIALVACSSTGTSVSGSPTPETIRVSGQGGGAITLTSNADASVANISLPMARVWSVLPVAYDSLGLTVAAADASTHILGNGGVKIRRQLGGVPLSRYIDCGAAQIGASADSYDVYLTVRTQVRPNGTDASSVSTMVEAMAKPVAFNQDYSSCSSTGRLEARLAEVIQAKARR
jgi:hypothetical protein